MKQQFHTALMYQAVALGLVKVSIIGVYSKQ
jgi:hypothetical protein